MGQKEEGDGALFGSARRGNVRGGVLGEEATAGTASAREHGDWCCVRVAVVDADRYGERCRVARSCFGYGCGLTLEPLDKHYSPTSIRHSTIRDPLPIFDSSARQMQRRNRNPCSGKMKHSNSISIKHTQLAALPMRRN
jgi:hypothetical protein